MTFTSLQPTNEAANLAPNELPPCTHYAAGVPIAANGSDPTPFPLASHPPEDSQRPQFLLLLINRVQRTA